MNKNKEFFALTGLFAYAILAGGIVLKLLYAWFIEPHWDGLSSVSILGWAGVSIFVSMLFPSKSIDIKEEYRKDLWDTLSYKIFSPWVVLGLAYLIYLGV